MESRADAVAYAESTPSASLPRALASSLFGFAFIAVAAVVERNVALAEQVAGTGQGVGVDLVSAAVWITAAFMAGFVAGYRAAGKGWLAGLFVGFYVTLGIVAIYQAAGYRLFEYFPVYFGAAQEGWAEFSRALSETGAAMWLSVLVLTIPASVYGGILGNAEYQDIGHLEDHSRHTLFHIPWWHWIWLLLLVPGAVVTDFVRSGHLLLLFLRLLWYQLTHHFLEIILGSQIAGDLVLLFSPLIGFAATGYGLMNLWDALSVRTDLKRRQRIGKAIWGLVLLIFVVNILWVLLSRMASSALGS